ncbi:transposase family protein [Deinococcus hopiensis]|nr:transposase family protein [Deinococcus hopiensis]
MNRKQFRRRTGACPETFAEMEEVLTHREGRKKKSGRPAALSVAEQLLRTLEFWREYRTFAHLGDDWGVHETTVERVEAALIANARFQLPKKRVFQEAQLVYSIVAVDAAEVACERPKKAARLVSDKKKRHTLKFQLLICTVTQRILSTATSAGAVHDPKLLRPLGVRFPDQTVILGDAGDQGLWRSHTHAITTHKATLASPLSAEQRQENRVLAYTRQATPHVIRRMKIFRILKGVCRHRCRVALRVQLIAALCNLTRACAS